MKKIILSTLLALLLSVPANAATTRYFSFDTGGNITAASSNSNDCSSISTPCIDFWGKNLQAANALQPGDIIYYDAGDTWPEASNQARIEVFSNGTSVANVRFLPYGPQTAGTISYDRNRDGVLDVVNVGPVLRGSTDITGWTLCTSGCASNVYYKTPVATWSDGQNLLIVTQGTIAAGNAKGLSRYGFTNASGTIRAGVVGAAE